MNFTDEALQILARQLGERSDSSRAELEAKMTKLLTLILRTGQGHPSLLHWVQDTLPAIAPAVRFGRPVDAKWAAPRLARLLCVELLRKTRAQRDTVVNRQSVVAC